MNNDNPYSSQSMSFSITNRMLPCDYSSDFLIAESAAKTLDKDTFDCSGAGRHTVGHLGDSEQYVDNCQCDINMALIGIDNVGNITVKFEMIVKLIRLKFPINRIQVKA